MAVLRSGSTMLKAVALLAGLTHPGHANAQLSGVDLRTVGDCSPAVAAGRDAQVTVTCNLTPAQVAALIRAANEPLARPIHRLGSSGVLAG